MSSDSPAGYAPKGENRAVIGGQMCFVVRGLILFILLSVMGCSGAAVSQPSRFGPAQGAPTDKARWSIQFADANGTNTAAAADDPASQVRVVEALGVLT